MIEIKSSGDFKNTIAFLNRLLKGDMFSNLDRYWTCWAPMHYLARLR